MSAKKLEEAIKEGLDLKTLEKRSEALDGGCISNCSRFIIDDDESIFVKTNSSLNGAVMFDGEFESLRQIQLTGTVLVPKPMLVLHNYDNKYSTAIVMEYKDMDRPLGNSMAKILGQKLANLHDYNNKVIRFNKRAAGWLGKRIPSVTPKEKTEDESDDDDDEDQDDREIKFSKHNLRLKGPIRSSPKNEASNSTYPERWSPEKDTHEVLKFGFDCPTSCGSIPQINEWVDDWVAFYARHRLDKTIRELLSDHGDRELSESWSQLQLKMGKFFCDIISRDEKIVPALLHGDLWSGNAAQLSDKSDPIIYDPSSFYGHNEYEFGIVRMFGGFPKIFEDSYFDEMPKRKLFDKRNKLYQLFHHLNHWNHFGSGYRSSSLKIIKDLNAMV